MGIAALIFWLLTAVGGFVLLGMWIARGGVRQPGSTRLPSLVVFGHFLLAALGLVVWIVYLAAGKNALSWAGFVLLIPIALLGFTLLARWFPVYRHTEPETPEPPERHFPLLLVAGHGAFAVVTVVLVLLTALGVGS